MVFISKKENCIHKKVHLFYIIRAINGAGDEQATSSVTFTVTSSNVHAPAFSGLPYSANLLQTSPTGTNIFLLQDIMITIEQDINICHFITIEYSILITCTSFSISNALEINTLLFKSLNVKLCLWILHFVCVIGDGGIWSNVSTILCF